jgi:hypothetical protein
MSRAASESWGIAIWSNRFYPRWTNDWKPAACSNLKDMISAMPANADNFLRLLRMFAHTELPVQ